MKKINKISIIGAGAIGTQIALCLQSQLFDRKIDINEIILYNHNYDLALGEASDIIDAIYFHKLFVDNKNNCCNIVPSADLYDIKDSDVIILTAGDKKKYIENKDRNAEIEITYFIAKELSQYIKNYAKNAFVIVVSNPVDLITWYLYELSEVPKNKIIGVGSSLDSARYAFHLKEELSVYDIKIDSIKSIVIGAHNKKNMLMLDSQILINNRHISELNLSANQLESILYNAREKTYDRGFFINKNKRQRLASISPSIIVSSIILTYLSEKSVILPVTLILNNSEMNLYTKKNIDYNQICIGVMAKINSDGAFIEELILDDSEDIEFRRIIDKMVNDKKIFDKKFSYKSNNDIKNDINKYFLVEENKLSDINSNIDLKKKANNDNLYS